MTRFRYRRLATLSSVTLSRPSRARRTSSCALRITLGFLSSSAMAHCSAVADVSLLAMKMSTMTALMSSLVRGGSSFPSLWILRRTSRKSSPSAPAPALLFS